MSDIDWDSNREDLLRRITKFFRSSGDLTGTYTEDQLNTLLWKFVGETGFFQVLFDNSLSLEQRLECIASMKCIYTSLFEQHCTRIMSNGLLDHPMGTSPLNSICYMWWDIFPHWGAPGKPELRDVDRALLALLSEILSIKHEACQESALHGLGHWHRNYPGETEKIIDLFISSNQAIPVVLKDYAMAARCGCIN